MGTYRLADSVVVEPLVNQWSAWSHLISPVTASLHLLNYQIETMVSYLDNPESHVSMYQNPELFGGPFIDIPPDRASEVAQLLADTRRRQSENIKFALSFEEFQQWLIAQAKGESLEFYYEKIPDALRGYVELIYDYFNRPGIRFLESLLYRSNLYDRGLQSLRLLSVHSDHSRTFFMSTPRLPQDDQIDWRVPFNDRRADDLFGLDVNPQPLERIREILSLSESDDRRLLPLISQDPLSFSDRWDERKIRVRYFGHACLLIEWNGVSILTDPYIGVLPVSGGMERLSIRDLPEKINYILITHNHADHLAIEWLLRLRHRTDYLVVPRSFGILIGDISLKLMGQELGFERVIEMESMDEIPLPDGAIIAVPFLGEHGDLAHGKTGFVVRCGNQQMLFAADSDYLDGRLYEHVCKSIGPIETVFLGMECVGAPVTWVFGPILPIKMEHHHEQSRRLKGCDSKAALGLLEKVGAKRIYNYAMGLEPWMQHILGLGLTDDSIQMKESNNLLAKARGRGFLASERLFGKREFYIEPYARKRTASVGPLPGDNVEPNFSMSIFQERLWHRFHSVTEAPPANISAEVRFEGRLQKQALEQSINEVVRRHEILRSRFSISGGQPVKNISPAGRIALSLADLSGLRPDRVESEASKLSLQHVRQPIDLGSVPLLRVALVCLGPERNLLLLTASAMVVDGPSMRVIVQQVIRNYEAFSEGIRVPETEASIQYDDYVRWQRQWLESEACKSELEYWGRQLDAALPVMELTADQPASGVKAFRCNEQSLFLSTALSESLKELSDKQGCSLFVTLLAGFLVLLYRYTLQEEMVVATKVSGRDSSETEPLIGPLTNTLVLRLDLSDVPNFLTLLSRVRDVTEAALAHRHLPFEMLTRNSCDGLKPGRAPQVMFTLDCAPAGQLELSGARITSRLISGGETGDCGLSMAAVDEGHSIVTTLTYDAALFDDHAVSLMLERFELLLEEVTVEPELLLFDAIITADEPGSDGEAPSGLPGVNDAKDQFVF